MTQDSLNLIKNLDDFDKLADIFIYNDPDQNAALLPHQMLANQHNNNYRNYNNNNSHNHSNSQRSMLKKSFHENIN